MIGIIHVTVGIAYKENTIIITSSNFGLKIATKTQNCRRKLKLVSNGAKCQADSENISYVNILFINRPARASAHEQKRIFRRTACVLADAR